MVVSSSDVSEAAPRHTPYCVTIYAAVHRGLHVHGSHYTSFYAGEGWFPPGLLVAALPLLSLPLIMQFLLLQGLRTSFDSHAYHRPDLKLQVVCHLCLQFTVTIASIQGIVSLISPGSEDCMHRDHEGQVPVPQGLDHCMEAINVFCTTALICCINFLS